jgi:P27 family predicted phage terminase small subunit
MKGRPPTPIAIHRARGSYRANRHGGTPEPPAAAPKVPKWLSKEAKTVWRYHAPRLANVQVLTELDQQCLAIYCCNAARLAKAEVAIAQSGEVIKTPAGFAAPNPWVAVGQKCQEMMLRYGQELGLSPAARARIKIVPKPESEVDPMAALLAKQRRKRRGA